MPKKKYIARVTHYSANEDPEVEELSEITSDSVEIDDDFEVSDEKIIQNLILKPAGYPIKPFDAPEKLAVTINDQKLFQAYASEQWVGLSVRPEDYIFDQLIIPDYAFKILTIDPVDANRIGIETKFVIKQPDPERPKFKPIQFSEIVGNKQALDKAKIIVKYLTQPEKFGEWAPKNILFHGPPGTGKTLSAKAIATAANCTFIARKGTALIGLHVGDGAAKIHQLFDDAKQNTPAIIFIDELDSIGLNRSYQSVRGDVVEVATALLAEMDGLETSEGIITIGATNGLNLLDPGLRSRFEEEIQFPLPNEKERIELLTLFSKNIPYTLNIDFEIIAKKTDKWSGRDIHEKLMKIAVHQAIQKDLKEITTENLLDIIKSVSKQKKDSQPPTELFL